MITVVSYNKGEHPVLNVLTMFADTKSEVPETGSATATSARIIKKPAPGSILYTARLEIAVLKSNDHWEWGD